VLNTCGGCSFQGAMHVKSPFHLPTKRWVHVHLPWLLSMATQLWSSASPTKAEAGNRNSGKTIAQNLNISFEDNPPVLPALRFVSCVSELQLLTDSTSSFILELGRWGIQRLYLPRYKILYIWLINSFSVKCLILEFEEENRTMTIIYSLDR
jgi:hypothetical protein